MTDISRLPGPVADRWDWQYLGACRDMDTELFFHPEGERGSTRRRRAEAAKAICASCPVPVSYTHLTLPTSDLV